jgi:hypothetical protein
MANLLEYADTIDCDIEITYYAQQDGRFTANLEGAEVKEGGCLKSEYGDSKTANGAINNYASLISGKTIVFRAMCEDRREFNVPILTQI